MISYKDKLLFLAFKKILTTYLHFIEKILNEESQSITLYKSHVPTVLSDNDQKYAYKVYDDMLYHNNQFKQIVQNIDSEILYFYSSLDFSLSITSVDNISEISLNHLKNIASLL